MLALIPLLPLASFLVLILWGRRLGKISAVISLAALLGSLVFSAFGFSELHSSRSPLHFTWSWLLLGGETLQIGLQYDPLSATLCGVVTVVGWLIMLYSIGYMGSDSRFPRFFSYLSLFFSAMLTLVLADNLILLYIGWEVVGLCSYLLISFWFEKASAANAGKKAFLTTRIGDLGLLAGILLIYWRTGSLRRNGLESKAELLGPWTGAAALLIFWGACGKSAQFPLHVWLPDAMEGPTPVSALIHAATMVAAGVYLVARTFPLFLASPDSLWVVAWVGAVTSFFAATIACTQTDLKRVLAYSTISQLGLMMMGLGFGSQFAGIFHLATHAWFKALLFLAAGSVIHAVGHQEMTRMGGLWREMPVTALTFAIAAATMAGVWPLSGFWSKEEILNAAAHMSAAGFPGAGQFFLMLTLVISSLTAFYISRAAILTFAGSAREEAHLHESPLVMTGPLVVLSLGAVAVGLAGSAWGGHRFQHFLGAPAHPEASNTLLFASVGVATAGILLALLRYGFKVQLLPAEVRALLKPVYRVVHCKYYVDELYEKVLINPALALARAAFRFDQKAIDGAVNGAGSTGLSLSRLKEWFDNAVVDRLVNALGGAIGWAGAHLRLVQTGLVQNYLLVAFGSAVILFILLKGIS